MTSVWDHMASRTITANTFSTRPLASSWGTPTCFKSISLPSVFDYLLSKRHWRNPMSPTWSLRFRTRDSNPIFVASSMRVHRPPTRPPAPFLFGRPTILVTAHISSVRTCISFVPIFPRRSRFFRGFKQLCPCITQNSVRDVEMPRNLTSYKNTILMTNCKKFWPPNGWTKHLQQQDSHQQPLTGRNRRGREGCADWWF